MTENEARLLLGKSPTETAAALLWFTGRPWALKLAVFQCRELCARSMLGYSTVWSLSFWASVAQRLSEDESLTALEPSPRTLAALKSIERRAFDAGLKQ